MDLNDPEPFLRLLTQEQLDALSLAVRIERRRREPVYQSKAEWDEANLRTMKEHMALDAAARRQRVR